MYKTRDKNMKKFILITSVILFGLSIFYYYSNKKEPVVNINSNIGTDYLHTKTFPIYMNDDFFEAESTKDAVCNCDININGDNWKKSFFIKINTNYIYPKDTTSEKISELLKEFSSNYCDYICDEFSNKIKEHM